MSNVRLSWFRFAAIALLAWLALGVVAAPLTACCADAAPCCAQSASGQGCMGCTTTPAACAGTSGVPSVMAAPSPDAVPAARTDALPVSPWKPPD